ncbi:DUF2062 domain-containing protein [Sneathiella marina]|uniref:DUF2062 domain-containing protein n=1 Tax=Sneathiella marina TaxID=2950108 RepID=A0ABY4VYJ6_9PROT|nr:DUF2062 domain-containing protein [Sneathiella marina]USG59814.1 DUF2062 domain-containing protein [Sneathiella marina]
MFRRRNKPTKTKQFGEFFWPSIGFKRSSKYVGYRLARLPGTSYSLAAGFAFGAAISFTPFIGLHFIISAILAWIFRANIIASALGTVVGNPWTFPFIWALIYSIGQWMLGHDETQGSFNEANMRIFFDGLWDGNWHEVSGIFFDVIHPMLIGCIPVSLVVWVIFFYPLKEVIRRFHAKRATLIGLARPTNDANGPDGNGNSGENQV